MRYQALLFAISLFIFSPARAFLSGGGFGGGGGGTLTPPVALDIIETDSSGSTVQYTHGTATGTTALTDGVICGYPTLSGKDYKCYQNELAPFSLGTVYGGTLTLDSNGMTFSGQPGFFSNGLRTTVTTKSSNGTLNALSGVYVLAPSGGDISETFLGSAGSGNTTGQAWTFMKSTATNDQATVTANGAETMGGKNARTFQSLNDAMMVVSDGTNLQMLGSFAPEVIPITASATALDTNRVKLYLCDATAGNVVITGYASAGHKGYVIKLKKIDASANTCTFDPNSTETVDGASTDAIVIQYVAHEYASDGTNWWMF